MNSTNPNGKVVVVAAGIIGLDVALLLAQRGYGGSITVLAEYLPGDTAPTAGCNFSAISGTDDNALRWDRLGYFHLKRLATEQPKEAFVSHTPSIELWDEAVPHEKIQTMSEYLQNNSRRGVKFAVSFSTITVNAPKHIEYLYKRLRDEYGVQFVRSKIPDLQSAFFDPAIVVVFNCTGMAAQTLPGVEDYKCYPTRGQVVLAKAPWVNTNIMRHGYGYETYVIPRPQSNGNVILGGYMQKGSSTSATHSYETESILDRTKELSSELWENDPEILAAFTGLRPSREGGARVQKEEIKVAGEKRTVVHNYGAGGTGFQAGYGMAVEAVACVDDILQGMQIDTRSRL